MTRFNIKIFEKNEEKNYISGESDDEGAFIVF
jgi:hypothetical protein